MNRERILDLANKLEALDEKHFDMNSFMRMKDDNQDVLGPLEFNTFISGEGENLHKCGTAGCIAGWTVAYFGRKDHPRLGSAWEYYAGDLLDLSELEAYDLFYGRWGEGPTNLLRTKTECVEHLRKIAS